MRGALGPVLENPATGYSVVYHLEIGVLFATLIVLAPLVRARAIGFDAPAPRGLVEFPT